MTDIHGNNSGTVNNGDNNTITQGDQVSGDKIIYIFNRSGIDKKHFLGTLIFLIVLAGISTWVYVLSEQKLSPSLKKLWEVTSQTNVSDSKKFREINRYFQSHYPKSNFPFLKEGDEPYVDLVSIQFVADKIAIFLSRSRNFVYVAFIDKETDKLDLENYNFGQDIQAITIIGQDDSLSPNALIEVKYNYGYGSGINLDYTSIYSIEKGNVLLSLNKPSYEYISGWGVFKNYLVYFKTKNTVIVNSVEKTYQIKTKGFAYAVEPVNSSSECKSKFGLDKDGDCIIELRKLPEEVYDWNKLTKQFEQTAGRVIIDKGGGLSEIYGDFMTMEGNWFKKPPEFTAKSEYEDFFKE
jgi:hypothetical protein